MNMNNKCCIFFALAIAAMLMGFLTLIAIVIKIDECDYDHIIPTILCFHNPCTLLSDFIGFSGIVFFGILSLMYNLVTDPNFTL